MIFLMIDEDVRSRIKIRIIGGKGNDTFDIKGHVPTVLYDIDTSANYVHHNNSHTRVSFLPRPDVNALTGSKMNIPIRVIPYSWFL